MLGSDLLEDWYGDELAGHPMPTNFEEFQRWAQDLIENPQRRGLNAMKNLIPAKQKENQIGRKFETYLTKVHQSMSPSLPEETYVQACVNKFRDELASSGAEHSNGRIAAKWIPSHLMLADGLTKPLTIGKLRSFLQSMSLLPHI